MSDGDVPFPPAQPPPLPAPPRRVLAVGDVHGCLTALETLSKLARFDPSTDLLIFVGDYVDRGPDTKGVIDWLIDYRLSGRLVTLLGNHEIMMLDGRADSNYRVGWFGVGGLETMQSYSPDARPAKITEVPDEHWEFMETCLPHYELDNCFLTHANADPGKSLLEQEPEWLFWRRISRGAPLHYSGKRMICGHTSQKGGEVLVGRAFTCIDTYAYGGGWLTALDLETGHYWQANQDREQQEGDIEHIPTEAEEAAFSRS